MKFEEIQTGEAQKVESLVFIIALLDYQKKKKKEKKEKVGETSTKGIKAKQSMCNIVALSIYTVPYDNIMMARAKWNYLWTRKNMWS